MGDLVELKITDKILLKRIMKEAKKELEYLYSISAGFQEYVPDEETRRMFEEDGVEI